MPTKQDQTIHQYGVNWHIKGNEIAVFSKELTKPIVATGPNSRSAILRDVLAGCKNVVKIRVSRTFAQELWGEGIITGAMLNKAAEIVNESISLEVSFEEKTVGLEITRLETSLQIYYGDGTSESHIQWKLNQSKPSGVLAGQD